MPTMHYTNALYIIVAPQAQGNPQYPGDLRIMLTWALGDVPGYLGDLGLRR